MQSSIGINLATVLDLMPDQLAVIVQDPTALFGVNKITLSKGDFFLFKFRLIAWAKKRKDPDDRYYPYETNNEDGCFSYNAEIKLRRARMTKHEREREIRSS